MVFSEELMNEQKELHREYNRKNGMTDKILAQKMAELQGLSDKYSWKKMRDLPNEERKAKQRLQDEEREKIMAKYAAMEKLTAEEKAEFRKRFDDLSKRDNEWRKARHEEMRLEVMRKLEQDVKIYINWAKSQMGG